MAKKTATQRAAFMFMLERFQNQQPFTKLDLRQASGSSAGTLRHLPLQATRQAARADPGRHLQAV